MRILLVDEQPGALVLLEAPMVQGGHDVMWAQDAREAVGLLHWPDAMLMSLRSQHLDGLALARVARALRPGLRLVFSVPGEPGAAIVDLARALGTVVHDPARLRDVLRCA